MRVTTVREIAAGEKHLRLGKRSNEYTPLISLFWNTAEDLSTGSSIIPSKQWGNCCRMGQALYVEIWHETDPSLSEPKGLVHELFMK